MNSELNLTKAGGGGLGEALLYRDLHVYPSLIVFTGPRLPAHLREKIVYEQL